MNMRRTAGILLLLISGLYAAAGSLYRGKAGEENSSCAITYSENEVRLVTETLACTEEQAEVLMREIRRSRIPEIQSLEQIIEEKGYVLEAEDTEGAVYLLYLDSRYHMYAVQAEDGEGAYLYRELE
ncbi:MAG: hypothetical protein KH452_01150 [Clostridiales bacterium]|nr:hypothetical protein [Clostridiales bacterium]